MKTSSQELTVPVWDASRRELSFAGEVVKRFFRLADCQELILAAFQEENWPPRIDNPLAADNGRTATQRLRDAVRKLNQQETPRIGFRCDGTGQGATWKIFSV